MTRLAGITAIYALIAALVLVAPLSASQDSVAPDDTASETAAPGASQPPEAAPPAAVPEQTLPQEAAPPGAAPPAAVPPPPSATREVAPPETASAPEPIPAEPAPAASPAPEPVARPKQRRSHNSPDARPRATAAADTNVTIRDFEFAPDSVTIDQGDTVTWTNEGPTSHSATAEDGSFDTGIYGEGQSRSHTFDQAGTFNYFCTPHPNMQATVTVRAASSGDDTGGGTDEGDTTGSDTGSDTNGTGAGSTGADDGSGSALPATGLDAGGLAVLGLMTLATGVWLRRRAGAAG